MVAVKHQNNGASSSRLILITTRKCNLDCSFCYVEKRNVVWETEKVKKCISQFDDGISKGKLIRFFGGEPLLEFNSIKEIIEWSKGRGYEFKYDITTNGLLIDEEVQDFFLKNVDVEIIASHKNEFEHDLNMKKIIPRMSVNFSLDPNLENSVEDFQKILAEGFRTFNFLPAYYIIWQKSEIDNLKKTFDEFLKILIDYNDAIRVKNLEINSLMPLFGTDITMDCDGSVYLGNFILDKRFKNIKNYFRVGGIDEIDSFKNIESIAKGIDYNRVLRQVFNEEVLECTLRVDKELSNFCNKLKA